MPAGRKARVRLSIATGAWLLLSGLGLGGLWGYATTAGGPGRPPATWPAETSIHREAGRPTLLVVLHPHCACSRATVGELARLLAQAAKPPAVRVLFPRPADTAADWERTDLWRAATAIPGVRVSRDDGEVETKAFGAQTSGQTLLYDTDGRLLFSGGITPARGHSGDNRGRTAILRLLRGDRGAIVETPVFGCHLTDAKPS